MESDQAVTSVEDLLQFNDDELAEVASDLNMPIGSRKKFLTQVKKLRDGGGGDAPPAATLALAVPADLQLKPERLTLGTEIGRGGFAVVFQGTYTSGGRVTDVAYKRIELGGAATPDDMKRIAREVQLMYGVALHHNVVTLLGACADPRAVDSAGASVSVGLMLEVLRNTGCLHCIIYSCITTAPSCA
jgi:hypothetical protein